MGRRATIMCPGLPGEVGCPENNERPLRSAKADPERSPYRRGTCTPCGARDARLRRERIKGAPCPGFGDFKGSCGQPITGTFCRRCTREEKQVWTWGISTREKRALFDAQGGLCPCGRPMEWDEHNGRNCVIDHCHKDGHIRALLHSDCNSAIGLLMEDADRALNLFRWLATDPRAPIQGHGGQRLKA